MVVITLGSQGLIWRRDGCEGRLPAPSVQAVDTTGAGDAFHGAYAAGLSSGLSWEALLRRASVAGAACCEVLGRALDSPRHTGWRHCWRILSLPASKDYDASIAPLSPVSPMEPLMWKFL